MVLTLLITGTILIGLGFVLSQVHIPLSQSEANSIFDKCSECKVPPTYQNVDPNITISIIVSGIPVLLAGIVLKTLLKKKSQDDNSPIPRL